MIIRSACAHRYAYVTNDARTIAQHRQLHFHQQYRGCGSVRPDERGKLPASSQISGAGGQLDFVLGAYLSKGGKSFICMTRPPLRSKDGTLESRIRPTLENGSVCYRCPSVRALVRHRVRQGKPQGSDCMAACGGSDLGCASGFPRAADSGSGEDAYLEALQ